MFDVSAFTAFDWLVAACVFIIGLCVFAALVLTLRTRDELTRAVVADLIFYGMLAIFLARSTIVYSSIAYDIALLAAIAGGVLPTLSMARIISKGRR